MMMNPNILNKNPLMFFDRAVNAQRSQLLTVMADAVLGKVHAGIRKEVIEDAGQAVANILNSQLIPAIIHLNYGHIPSLSLIHISEGQFYRCFHEEKDLFCPMVVTAFDCPHISQERIDRIRARVGGNEDDSYFRSVVLDVYKRQALETVAGTGGTVDALTVIARLEAQGQLDAVGGHAGVVETATYGADVYKRQQYNTPAAQ